MAFEINRASLFLQFAGVSLMIRQWGRAILVGGHHRMKQHTDVVLVLLNAAVIAALLAMTTDRAYEASILAIGVAETFLCVSFVLFGACTTAAMSGLAVSRAWRVAAQRRLRLFNAICTSAFLLRAFCFGFSLATTEKTGSPTLREPWESLFYPLAMYVVPDVVPNAAICTMLWAGSSRAQRQRKEVDVTRAQGAWWRAMRSSSNHAMSIASSWPGGDESLSRMTASDDDADADGQWQLGGGAPSYAALLSAADTNKLPSSGPSLLSSGLVAEGAYSPL